MELGVNQKIVGFTSSIRLQVVDVYGFIPIMNAKKRIAEKPYRITLA
jgi:hypothetical protein